MGTCWAVNSWQSSPIAWANGSWADLGSGTGGSGQGGREIMMMGIG